MEILLSISSKSDGSVREVTRTIENGLAIGRGAEEGILLEGLDLSREHFVLTADGSDVRITDLSVNGTWLNGTRLRKSVPSKVNPGDKIEIPGYTLSFRLTDQAEERAEVEELPVAAADFSPAVAVPAPKSGPFAMLAPVSRFIGSFTFMEKLMVVIGLTGLILLCTYIAA